MHARLIQIREKWAKARVWLKKDAICWALDHDFSRWTATPNKYFPGDTYRMCFRCKRQDLRIGRI